MKYTPDSRPSTLRFGIQDFDAWMYVCLPISSAMNRESPITMGVMNVPLCFSAASMKMVKTSKADRNISMNSPWMILVPPPSSVRTVKGPGRKVERIAAAVMPPRIWAMVRSAPRV